MPSDNPNPKGSGSEQAKTDEWFNLNETGSEEIISDETINPIDEANIRQGEDHAVRALHWDQILFLLSKRVLRKHWIMGKQHRYRLNNALIQIGIINEISRKTLEYTLSAFRFCIDWLTS